MREGKRDFYQSKYTFYRQFSFWVCVFSCLASVTYFVSDCQLFGRFAWETLLPRSIILLPMLGYIAVYRKCSDYRWMVPISYVILHLIMWNTIWAIVYLPDRTHASEGFIIMHLMFFAIGFCAPFSYSTVAHVLLIADILISNSFNHYANLDIMLSLGIPCVVAICAVHYCMQRLYAQHYKTEKELEHISRYDQLTDVYNRNVLNELTVEETGAFLKEAEEELCILLFDIDDFKNVNDTHGHIGGDKVLKAVAGLAREKTGKNNYIIRWGGEEFVMLLYGQSLAGAKAFAEELRQQVEAMDTGVCPVTISIGVTRYNGRDNYQLAVQCADKALYQAKNDGRNRVVVYGEKDVRRNEE